MKFLAVSQNRGDPTPFLPAETEQMANLLADGLVQQFFVKTDYSGVVLIVESTTPEAAAAQLATLPLVKAQVTEFALTRITDPPGPPPG